MLLDTGSAEDANRRHLTESEHAQGNLRLCSRAIDFLRNTTSMPELNTEDDIVHLRLGIRLINDAGAFGQCALAGYYQPALAMVRDICEIGFLLELFAHDRSHLSRWHRGTDSDRNREYKPLKVREKLNAFTPLDKAGRDDAYKFLSTHGTHVHPGAIQVISPGTMTVVGPFPDQQRITLITFDIAKFLGYATAQFAKGVRTDGIANGDRRLAFVASKLDFSLGFIEWRAHAAAQPQSAQLS